MKTLRIHELRTEWIRPAIAARRAGGWDIECEAVVANQDVGFVGAGQDTTARSGKALRQAFAPAYRKPRFLDSQTGNSTFDDMRISLTPEQKDFVHRAVESGRIERAEDAVQEALAGC